MDTSNSSGTLTDSTDYWITKDMYAFENIGFTRPLPTDNGVSSVQRYMCCADCEMGPLGFVIEETYYLKCDRVSIREM